jgi:hypothetical protein
MRKIDLFALSLGLFTATLSTPSATAAAWNDIVARARGDTVY